MDVSGGSTANHLVTGLQSGINYTIKVVGTSQHLPSQRIATDIKLSKFTCKVLSGLCFLMPISLTKILYVYTYPSVLVGQSFKVKFHFLPPIIPHRDIVHMHHACNNAMFHYWYK